MQGEPGLGVSNTHPSSLSPSITASRKEAVGIKLSSEEYPDPAGVSLTTEPLGGTSQASLQSLATSSTRKSLPTTMVGEQFPARQRQPDANSGLHGGLFALQPPANPAATSLGNTVTPSLSTLANSGSQQALASQASRELQRAVATTPTDLSTLNGRSPASLSLANLHVDGGQVHRSSDSQQPLASLSSGPSLATLMGHSSTQSLANLASANRQPLLQGSLASLARPGTGISSKILNVPPPSSTNRGDGHSLAELARLEPQITSSRLLHHSLPSGATPSSAISLPTTAPSMQRPEVTNTIMSAEPESDQSTTSAAVGHSSVVASHETTMFARILTAQPRLPSEAFRAKLLSQSLPSGTSAVTGSTFSFDEPSPDDRVKQAQQARNAPRQEIQREMQVTRKCNTIEGRCRIGSCSFHASSQC